MSDEADSDKQYEASQKKLDDARKKGEIAKSTDLMTAAAYAGFILAGVTLGGQSLLDLLAALSIMLRQSEDIAMLVFSGSQMPIMGGVFAQIGKNTAIWFAFPAALVVLSVLAQQAFVFAPTKIAPKLSRISPLSGINNKFGRQGLFEFLKSFTKLTIYSVILAMFLKARIEHIVAMMALPPAGIVIALLGLVMSLMGIVFCVAATLGIIDYLWQHAEHQRKNRMSRKEMMDELKNSDGDPAMKQQRRQRAIDIAMNKMLADVPTADVVIVNPTHYAVALKWDRAAGTAPVCVAKGVDEIAAQIRELAHEHAVPIHSDPPTARALHAGVNIGDQITPEHYQAVAAAIRFAEKMRIRARRLG